jgi:hypothetical protein
MKDKSIVRTASITLPTESSSRSEIAVTVIKDDVYIGGYTVGSDNRLSYNIDDDVIAAGKGPEALQVLKDNGLSALYGEKSKKFKAEPIFFEYDGSGEPVLSPTAFSDLKGYIVAEKIPLESEQDYVHRF